jgi:hypothetical protein
MTTTVAASFAANVYFGIFLLVAAVGLVFGYFTTRGSGIDNHPTDGRGAAPGSKLPDEFHQFADRQVHDADIRHADHDMTIDDVNRRLAEDAAAHKEARRRRSEAREEQTWHRQEPPTP